MIAVRRNGTDERGRFSQPAGPHVFVRSLDRDTPDSLESHQVYPARVLYVNPEQEECITRTVAPSGQCNLMPRPSSPVGKPDFRMGQVPSCPRVWARVSQGYRVGPSSPSDIMRFYSPH